MRSSNEKSCPKCGQWLPLSKFYGPYGAYCKTCTLAIDRARRAKKEPKQEIETPRGNRYDNTMSALWLKTKLSTGETA